MSLEGCHGWLHSLDSARIIYCAPRLVLTLRRMILPGIFLRFGFRRSVEEKSL